MSSSNGDNRATENQLRRAGEELERRLRAGEKCRAEDYLSTRSELGSHVDSALDLIYREYATRVALGDPPARQEYYDRFPHWRDRLEQQFQVHDLFSVDDAHPTVPAPDSTSVTDPARRLPLDAPWQDGYEELEQVGHGGPGVVYKARQYGLGRIVALKTLKAGRHATLDEITRFRGEAEKMAKLRHPNIVQVIAVGTRDGVPCFSMEFLEGGTLGQKIAGKSQPAAQAAEWVEILARAVQYAHEHNVIHRDIKPANVLFDADGQLKLTDFGLAKCLDSDTALTRTGGIIGTPGYIPPEMIAGRVEDSHPRGDVYGLGAVLYELLTGRPPFRGQTVMETIQLTERGNPAPLHALEPNVDRKLEAICMKCLERRPRHRYATAGELADDLACWRTGQTPRPARRLARISRFARRHLAACAATFLLLALAISVPLWRYFRSPERQFAVMLDNLRSGRPVQVLGAEGRPPHCKLIVGDDFTVIRAAEDGAFCLEAGNKAMVEFVDDPQCSQYRMSLRVRHEQVPQDYSEVGVYFSYELVDVSGKVAHRFFRLTFNATKAPGRIRYLPVGAIPAKLVAQIQGIIGAAPGAPPLALAPQVFAVYKDAELDEFGALPVARQKLVLCATHLFKPVLRSDSVRYAADEIVFALPPPGQWNDLRLTVTPERIEFEFAGQSRVITSDKLSAGTVRPAGHPPAPRFELNPRGGLGFYIDQGTASFSNVVVEPLPENP
jgi:serine/threonine-protein kinase